MRNSSAKILPYVVYFMTVVRHVKIAVIPSVAHDLYNLPSHIRAGLVDGGVLNENKFVLAAGRY